MFVGLVGKPSAGKSTLFKAITLMDVPRANYPFTTIKPNSGIGHVRLDCVDTDFDTQCNPRVGKCIGHKRFVPVEILDVAGLVPGAHEGKGLGLEFLNDLSQADALIHVVDMSGSLNEKGEPVDRGSHDPADDIRFLEHELDMWYYNIFQRVWKKFSFQVNQTKENIVKAISKQFSGLRVDEDMVKRALKDLSLIDRAATTWSDDEVKALAKYLRIETKPILIAANKIDVPGAMKNLERIKSEFPDYLIIGCSAESELALKEATKHGVIDYIPGDNDFKLKEGGKLSEKQRDALNFIRKSLLEPFGSTGVQEVLDKTVFDLLHYVAIFPGGVGKLEDSEGRVLPDCFLLPPGTSALDFAYSLHSDFGDNFIRAINVKTKLAMKKDHPLSHRDVVEIIFNK